MVRSATSTDVERVDILSAEDKRKQIKFIRSGCTLLDCILGMGKGSYPIGRVINIVGDQSTGKTLLLIEAMANFKRQYPKGTMHYVEAEGAFDEDYAEAVGLPVDDVRFHYDIGTVEELFDLLDDACEDAIKEDRIHPTLIGVDSFDGISDQEELARDLGQGSYNLNKQKKIKATFRRLGVKMRTAQVCLIIISQTTAKINSPIPGQRTRSGGEALNFWSSIIFYLKEIGKIDKTSSGVKRITGITVRARCTKNKVAPPYRECSISIIFNYGMEDIRSNLEWLKSEKKLHRLADLGLSTDDMSEDEEKPVSRTNRRTTKKKTTRKRQGKAITPLVKKIEGDKDKTQMLEDIVKEEYTTMEKAFLPDRKKYDA